MTAGEDSLNPETLTTESSFLYHILTVQYLTTSSAITSSLDCYLGKGYTNVKKLLDTYLNLLKSAISNLISSSKWTMHNQVVYK